jgi:mono/diheme cytochrome c family protein
MDKVVVAVVLCGLSVAIGAGSASAADASANYQKHCAMCHGANGRGGTATPPIAGMAAGKVAKAVTDHPSPMQKTGMSADEIAEMGRYVAGLKK